MATKCITPVCKTNLSTHARVPDCPTCRAAYRYRKKQRPAKILKRRMNLDLYHARIDVHFDKEGKLK